MSEDVTRFFRVVRETSEGWKACCPRCEDRSFKFYFNTEKGVGCCMHYECPWYKERGGATLKRLFSYFNLHGFEPSIPEVVKSSKEADVSLPKEFELVKDLDGRIRDDIYDYLSSRGLPRKLVDRARVGYCAKGRHWGYMIFPVFDESGEVVYWQGRRFKEREPKFWNPKSSKKMSLVYRIGLATRPSKIILVESIINTLTLETPAKTRTLVLGLLGSTMSSEGIAQLSPQQLDYILMYERWVEEVIVALDPDARRKAVEIAERIPRHIVPAVKIAQFPDNTDVNSLGRERAWDILNRAPVFDPTKRTQFILGRVS